MLRNYLLGKRAEELVNARILLEYFWVSEESRFIKIKFVAPQGTDTRCVFGQTSKECLKEGSEKLKWRALRPFSRVNLIPYFNGPKTHTGSLRREWKNKRKLSSQTPDTFNVVVFKILASQLSPRSLAIMWILERKQNKTKQQPPKKCTKLCCQTSRKRNSRG